SLRAAEDALMARATEAEQRLRGLHEQLRPREAELAALEERAAQLESRLASLRVELTQAASGHEAAALALQRAEHEVQSIKAGLETDLALDPVDLPRRRHPRRGCKDVSRPCVRSSRHLVRS